VPVDSILVSAAVVAVFAVFSGVLIWGEFLTQPIRQETVSRNKRCRSSWSPHARVVTAIHFSSQNIGRALGAAAPFNLVAETSSGHAKMSEFRVSFYKSPPDASGHSSKHRQRQFDLTADSPSGALVAAERLFDPRASETDCVEVVNISPAGRSEANQHSPSS
jgi:hypothetical protein